jgi:SAM-dependent methyltransferase
MEMEEVKKIFHALYDDVNGRSLSLEGREKNQFTSKSFVYGEVVPDSFYQMILDTNPQPGYTFYDLGSGTGKGVILAHLLFKFPRCIGIEYLDTLHNAAIGVQKRYETEIRPNITTEVEGSIIKFIHGDILKEDLSDADLIFMNSTCFQDDLMEALEPRLETIKPHAQVISLSKALKSPSFHQHKHKMYEFSWGQATAFYHRKRLWKVYM